MADEGVGIFLVEKLHCEANKFPFVDFVDAGTGGMSLLTLIENRKKAILIDCAYMDEPAGTIVKFTPDEVKSVKKLVHQSLHEADILNIIRISKQLGTCPERIVIFGIEPAKIEQHPHLTQVISERIDEYIQVIYDELNRSL